MSKILIGIFGFLLSTSFGLFVYQTYSFLLFDVTHDLVKVFVNIILIPIWFLILFVLIMSLEEEYVPFTKEQLDKIRKDIRGEKHE